MRVRPRQEVVVAALTSCAYCLRWARPWQPENELLSIGWMSETNDQSRFIITVIVRSATPATLECTVIVATKVPARSPAVLKESVSVAGAVPELSDGVTHGWLLDAERPLSVPAPAFVTETPWL